MRDDLPELRQKISNASRIDIEIPDDFKPVKKKISVDRNSLRPPERNISMRKMVSNASNPCESISYMWKGN